MYQNDGCGSGAGAWMSSMWGIVIFFLILFWVFSGNRNGFGNGFVNGWNGWNATGMPWGLNEHTPKDNDARLSEIKATMDKDTAVLTGQLETAFREVINVSNTNTGRVLDGQKDLYIKQLERENTQLFITAQNDALKNQMLMLQGATDRRLDSIEAQMLKVPPVYPTVCVPCSTNCCGGRSGCDNA